jgi:hypothetical protein
MAADRATGGYWLVASDGGVFTFNAPFYGSAAGGAGPQAYFSIAATPSARGYLVAGQIPAT